MRFKLVYDGDLGSSGNSNGKPGSVVRIREQLSPQLERLWDTHNSLKVLAQNGVIQVPGSKVTIYDPSRTPRDLANEYPHDFTYLGDKIPVGGKSYTPLVRMSLNLACEIKILFLRDQDPGDIFDNKGDLDNRIKTLFDALRMPKKDEQDKNEPDSGHLFCLLEDDSLISDFSVQSDRLLIHNPGKHKVMLILDVRINVLQVGPHNMCLL
jgi:hypothetical protein